MLTMNGWQNWSSATCHSVPVMIAADDGAWAVDYKVQSAPVAPSGATISGGGYNTRAVNSASSLSNSISMNARQLAKLGVSRDCVP
jgi:hypothetical protein